MGRYDSCFRLPVETLCLMDVRPVNTRVMPGESAQLVFSGIGSAPARDWIIRSKGSCRIRYSREGDKGTWILRHYG